MSDVNQAVLTTGLLLLLANANFIRLVDVRIGRWAAKVLLVVIALAHVAASAGVVETTLAAMLRLLP